VDLYCAIDVMDLSAVRLTRGDFAARTDFGDPVALAMRYVSEGARRLHVVDLDAARDGTPANRELLIEISRTAPVPVQVGGGARTAEDVSYLLEQGIDRVVLGTVVVEAPDLVDQLARAYPQRIAIGLDHRGGTVATRGWLESSEITVESVLERFASAPIGAVIVTAIERDGTMSGPDTAGLRRILALTGLPLIASGGVRSADDLATLAAVSAVVDGTNRRMAGAIVGRALADGSLRVAEGIEACEQSE
jgi:phosphoribosylformimino-5-aminoimidazole carboxamide ribotide isomerase